MPCYHPMRMVYHGYDGRHLPIAENIRDIKKIYTFERAGFHELDSNNILIPCRRCIGCRLDYSRRWADRLMLELDHSGCAVFLTLTYNDDNLLYSDSPDDEGYTWPTLSKEHIQLFNKRLRFHFSDKQIRFFTTGEYGSKNLRPHYHGIYFGLSLKDFPDRKLLQMNNFNQCLYKSEKLSDIWSHGYVAIGEVSWQSCAYVARYNLKKLGAGDDDFTKSRGVLPEFGLMSRRPGICGYFMIDHPEVFDNPTDKIFLKDINGVNPVKSVSLPSYLFEKLELVNPELYDKIKQDKKDSSTHRFLDELSETDLDEFEYLSDKERKHENFAKALKRPL